MSAHREPFYSLFPGARGERPAIVLRVGQPLTTPRRSLRIPVAELTPAPQTGGHGIGYKST